MRATNVQAGASRWVEKQGTIISLTVNLTPRHTVTGRANELTYTKSFLKNVSQQKERLNNKEQREQVNSIRH